MRTPYLRSGLRLFAVELLHAVSETGAVAANHFFVHDIKRSSVLCGKLNSISAAYGEVSFFIDTKIFGYKHFYPSFRKYLFVIDVIVVCDILNDSSQFLDALKGLG